MRNESALAEVFHFAQIHCKSLQMRLNKAEKAQFQSVLTESILVKDSIVDPKLLKKQFADMEKSFELKLADQEKLLNRRIVVIDVRATREKRSNDTILKFSVDTQAIKA